MSFSMQTLPPVSQSSKASPPTAPTDEEIPGVSMSPGSSQCSPISGPDALATANFVAGKPAKGMLVPNPVTGWAATATSNPQAGIPGLTKMQEIPSNDSLQGSAGSMEEGGPNRRLKRLERNRESARLSRRRRKHYLEVLEEKVTKMANDVDEGRRLHVSQMVMVILNKRSNLIQTGSPLHILQLETALSRASQEAAIAGTFRWQQLNSLCLPPSTKFILWLTLQNDSYFRGGRAASERLSAARIGERMLHSGTDKVTPSHSMWPLFCNEVGLSYDQEEKVRAFQRTLLLTHESWLNRHVAFASLKTMESVHDALQTTQANLAQRESGVMTILTPEQRIKFLGWAQRNKERVQKAPVTQVNATEKYQNSSSHHVAANLYILNHKLQTVFNKLPKTSGLLDGSLVKKLSRRPLFESLGGEEKASKGLARDGSFASSGSLKRSASHMSIDDEGQEQPPAQPTVSPEEAENAAKPLINQVLGHVAEIIPPPPISLPAPTPMSSMMPVAQPDPMQHVVVPSGPRVAPTANLQTVSSMPDIGSAERAAKHSRTSSFLPLNAVPEEMWPADAVADEFLMNLVDGDWAIGEGVEF